MKDDVIFLLFSSASLVQALTEAGNAFYSLVGDQVSLDK